MRNLEVIGEAAKKVRADVREKYPDIEWKKICGLGDILAHEYFGVDLDVIWDVVKGKLPTLKTQIKHVLKSSK